MYEKAETDGGVQAGEIPKSSYILKAPGRWGIRGKIGGGRKMPSLPKVAECVVVFLGYSSEEGTYISRKKKECA